jgi:stage III sporulation protein AF
MMAWLGEWLGQVLAVLLLAAVVDLLVPGKAYERYTRLALGLIILTAMLGPLLKLFREDPERLLGRGFAGLEAQADRSTPRMPGLNDIRREAGELRERRERQARELAARAIEASIREAVNRLGGPKAREVRAEIAEGRDGAEIRSVSIVLEAGEGGAEGAAAGAEPAGGPVGGNGERIRIGPIEPVAPVDAVRVRVGGAFPASGREDGEDGRPPDGLRAAPDGIAAVIRAVVHQGWGVEPDRITVWMPA